MSYKTKEEIKEARALLSPPGETLLETIEAKGISQSELARRTGRHVKTINEIIQGKSSISPQMAIQLEKVLGISAEFWMERDRNYSLELAELDEAENTLNARDWAKQFPVNEMRKLGWVDYQNNNDIEKVTSLFHFFGVSDQNAFAEYFNDVYQGAFRYSEKFEKNPYAIAAWLRQGEIQAEKIEAPEYSEKKFKQKLKAIKDLMAKQPIDFFDQLQQICLEAGVKVLHTHKLPKAPINGSTRWLQNSPVIQLTDMYKRNDIFWFTFFHEAGHILLHGKKDIFMEFDGYKEEDHGREQEANEFAVQWTLTEKQEKEIRESWPLKAQAVLKFAERFNTHPAIIVGRLQREGIINHNKWRNFFEKINLGEN
jgi:addiction module HigA family antidote